MNFSFSFHLSLRSSAAIALIASLVARAQESVTVPLDQIVAEINANNPEAKFYEVEIAIAKAGARSAVALNDPAVSLDLGHKRVRDRTGALAGSGAAWSVP